MLHNNKTKKHLLSFYTQPAIICSKLRIKTLEEEVKYVNNKKFNNKDTIYC